MQSLLRAIYPTQCAGCAALVEEGGTLCGACWRDTPFLRGVLCDACAQPLPGEAADPEEVCDDCLAIARPWTKGRAAMAYDGTARRMVLAFKHGDRLDLAAPAAVWLAQAGRDILLPEVLLVPVPVHWRRLFRRRYNQAAVLSSALARRTGHATAPLALVRHQRTPVLDGKSRDDRFAALSGAISPHPRHGAALSGRHVVIVDDVMTSGATLAAAADAASLAGARSIAVLVLARVAKAT